MEARDGIARTVQEQEQAGDVRRNGLGANGAPGEKHAFPAATDGNARQPESWNDRAAERDENR